MSGAEARLRRLPLVDRPFRRETIRSFVTRLAALNYLEHTRLAELVDARLDRQELCFPSDDIVARLSSLTGFSASRLALAFPPRHRADLTARDQPGPEDFTNRPWLACRFCSAGRRPHGAQVKQWPLLALRVCIRHRRWIGPGRRVNGRQLDLTGAPMILAAAQRHQVLWRRAGPVLTTRAISEATTVLEENLRTEPVSPEVHMRLSVLLRADVTSLISVHLKEDAYVAAIYPDVVELAHLLLTRSPSGSKDYWRDPGFVRFQQQIKRNDLRAASESGEHTLPSSCAPRFTTRRVGEHGHQL